jgi:hypothetical protein
LRQQKKNKITEASIYFSIINLNANGLYSLIKDANWVTGFKKHPTNCCLQKTYLTGKDTDRLKVKG